MAQNNVINSSNCTSISTVNSKSVGNLTINQNTFNSNKVKFSYDVFADDVIIECPWPTESDPDNKHDITMKDIRDLIEEEQRQEKLRREYKMLRDSWNHYQMCLKLIDNSNSDK